MKVVQINSVCGVGSTGRIAVDISNKCNDEGIENYILYGIGKSKHKNAIKFGGSLNVRLHQLGTRLLGKHGFYSTRATRKLVDIIEDINPDIIHLHNIHGHYINVKVLFEYLAASKKRVIWTLHDCWSFTGHCAYYDFAHCYKWQSECCNCSSLKDYPKSLIFDKSKESYNEKKRLFNSIDKMVLVTPSKWLAEEVKKSYLNKYPLKVINNGIDLLSFNPTISDFRKKLGIEDKFIILGVASEWSRRKGLRYFIDLARIAKDDEIIIIVGLSRNQQKKVPHNVISIPRTNSINELAEIYSAANVFVNLTLEDNFPTTNIEAMACGVPVITFDTGGSPEAVNTQTGIVVEKGNIDSLLVAIETIKMKGKLNYSSYCIDRAKSRFDKIKKFREYVEVYMQC